MLKLLLQPMLFNIQKLNHLFLISACLILLSLFCTSSFATTEIEKQTSNLKDLRKKIALIQSKIEQETGIKHQYISDLRSLDKNISKYSKKIRRLNSKQRLLNIKSNKLRKGLKASLKKMLVQQKALSKQVQITYKIGQQQAIQILLNQKSVESISRTLTYANYLSKARSHQIYTTKQLSKSIKESVSELKLQQDELKENQLLLESNKASYTDTYSARKRLLNEITRNLLSKKKDLNILVSDSKRLHKLVKSLGEILFDIPPPPQELLPFAKLKGKLRLPVTGKVIHKFREKKNNRRMYWKGIVLKTKRGIPVHSIHSGRIVFSDWLNGYGNIIIIDHGSNYLSLYAYNQSLEKEIGEWVVANDIIATTGQSGGQKQNALYFEIRKNGKPVNPLKWIKKG